MKKGKLENVKIDPFNLLQFWFDTRIFCAINVVLDNVFFFKMPPAFW